MLPTLQSVPLKGNNSENIPLIDSTRVASIKLYRAKVLDEIYTKHITIEGIETKVPFDIDDLDVSDDFASNANTVDEVTMHAMANPLHWRNVADPKYQERIRTYSNELKHLYRQIVEVADKNPDTALNILDITAYTQINGLTRGLGMPSTLSLSVSLLNLRTGSIDERKKRPEMELPRENDLVEVMLYYPQSGRTVRTFLGFVTAITTSEIYGSVTNINLECNGIMKHLMVHKMVGDRAVLTQFESGELLQPGITPWSTNAYAANTIDEIFVSIMTSQLAMKVKRGTNSTKIEDEATLLKAEAASAGVKLQQLDADKKVLTRIIGQSDAGVIESNLSKIVVKKKQQVTHPYIVQRAKEENISTDKVCPSIDKSVRVLIREDVIRSAAPIGFDTIDTIKETCNIVGYEGKSLEDYISVTGEQLDYALDILAIEKLSQRISDIRIYLKKISDELLNKLQADKITIVQLPKSVIEMEPDIDALRQDESFQLLYVPLITLILYAEMQKKAGIDVVMAKFSARQLAGFDLLLRGGFKLFFSDLKTPWEILKQAQDTSKLIIYESEDGKMVCEIPRFNEFVADSGEDISDFVIANPINVQFTRQDVGLLARKDVNRYIPYIGSLEQTAGTPTARYYTDPAVLVRYGMRATDPVYNPNAMDNFSTAFYAALEATCINAMTRTMTVTADGTRPYKLGRLYFIARKSHTKIMGGTTSARQPDGFVGQLASYSTDIVANQNIVHKLTFIYVRRATLVTDINGKLKANFKMLPNVDGLMMEMQKSIQDGKLNPYAYARETTPPQGVVSATIIGSPEDDIYIDTVIQEGSFGVQNVEDLYLKHTHHKQLPPTTAPGFTHTTDQGLTHVAKKKEYTAVMRVRDIPPGGLTQDIIHAVAWIDMYLRSWDVNLKLSGQSDPGSILNYRDKNLDMLYWPSVSINPMAKMTDLEGMHLNILNPQAPSGSSISYINGQIMTSPLGSTYVYTPSNNGIVLSGISFRVVQTDIKNQFVVLRVAPASKWFPGTFEYRTSSGATETKDLEPTSITQIEQDKVRIVAYLVTQGIDQATAINQFNAAVNYYKTLDGGTTSVQNEFYAVMIKQDNTTLDLMKYYIPGIPFTVFDMASVDTNRLYTGQMGMTASSSQGAVAHSLGVAMDIYVSLWYAYTGLRFKRSPLESFVGSGDIMGGSPTLNNRLAQAGGIATRHNTTAVVNAVKAALTSYSQGAFMESDFNGMDEIDASMIHVEARRIGAYRIVGKM